MKIRNVLFVASVAIAVQACVWRPVISGMKLSGEEVVRTVDVTSDYSAMHISNAIFVTYSDTAHAVTLVADSAVMPYIQVKEAEGRLSIYVDRQDNMKFRDHGIIKATVPSSSSLSFVRVSGASSFKSQNTVRASRKLEVKVSGASDFTADLVSESIYLDAGGASDIRATVSADFLKASASGASDVILSGKVKDYKAHSSGASSISSGKSFVDTDTFACEISGASSCHVKCNGSATGSVSGASSLVIAGDGDVHVKTSGASDIRRR